MDVSANFGTCSSDLKTCTSDGEHCAAKLVSQKSESASENKELSTKLMTKDAEIKRLQAELTKAKTELTEANNANKDIHSSISSAGYCNYTAMMVDANTTLSHLKTKTTEYRVVAQKRLGEAALVATDLASEGLDRASKATVQAQALTSQSIEVGMKYATIGREYAEVGLNEVHKVTKPHLEKTAEVVGTLYDAHAKKIVDKKVLPVYNEKVEPHVSVALKKINEGVAIARPKISELRGLISNAYVSGKITAITVVMEGSKAVSENIKDVKALSKLTQKLEYLGEKEVSMLRRRGQSFKKSLNHVASANIFHSCPSSFVPQHSTVFVNNVIRVFLFLFFLRYGLRIVRISFTLVAVVWRIVFWPFFLFGGKKKNRNLSDDKDLTVEEVNGH